MSFKTKIVNGLYHNAFRYPGTYYVCSMLATMCVATGTLFGIGYLENVLKISISPLLATALFLPSLGLLGYHWWCALSVLGKEETSDE